MIILLGGYRLVLYKQKCVQWFYQAAFNVRWSSEFYLCPGSDGVLVVQEALRIE